MTKYDLISGYILQFFNNIGLQKQANTFLFLLDNHVLFLTNKI